MSNQPIEALLDEVDAYFSPIADDGVTVFDKATAMRLSRELRQRISEIDEAMKVMGHKSPETLIGAARNTTYARDIEKQNAEAAMVKLRQRIEREQELATVLKLETHIKDGLREELTLANLTITDLRQQLEQQQQSEEMK